MNDITRDKEDTKSLSKEDTKSLSKTKSVLEEKKEFLLSIPDAIDVVEASKTVAAWFVKVKKSFTKFAVKNSPKYQLENYVCFHQDFKYGVYLDKEKFYFVSILRPKKFLGIESEFTIQVVCEILTDALDDSYLEKSSIAGATLLRKDTPSEKAFFKAVTSYDEKMIDDEAKKLQEEIIKKNS